MLSYDVVIIGSGIAGMTAAIYLKRAGLNILVIEQDAPGGQMNRSPNIENYPGFKSIDGPTLSYNIYNQVTDLDCEYLFDKVKGVNFDDKIINTSKKEIKYNYLIIATGRSPRKLNLPEEEKLIGRGISYCALCDGNLYKNKDIVVVGGGNSALEEALYLSYICKSVTLIHRRDEFTAEQETIDEVKDNQNIKVIYNVRLVDYEIKDNKIDSVILDTKEKVKTDGIFVSIGYIPNSEIFDLEKENGYIITKDDYVTSNKYVYACGDIIKKNFYQITTAIGEATTAAASIIKKLK